MDLLLRDIAEVQIGYQPRGPVEAARDGTHLLIQGRDLDFGRGMQGELSDPAHWRVRMEQLDRVTPKGDTHAYRVGPCDILFLSRGAKPAALTIGSESLQGLNVAGENLIAAYNFYIVRPTAAVVPGFLAWFINQEPSQAFLQTHLRGSAAKLLPKPALEEMPVVVPPQSLQHRIVEIDRLRSQEESLVGRLLSARRRLVQAACLAAIESESTKDTKE